MARWITLKKVPYNHRFPTGAWKVWRGPGEYFEKDDVADRMVATKYAVEGKESEATKTAKSAKAKSDAADTRPADDVGADGVPSDGGADDSAPVGNAG